MTEEQIVNILNIPCEKIVEHCQDRRLLFALLALAYHKGIKKGLKDAHDDMNLVFHTISSAN